MKIAIIYNPKTNKYQETLNALVNILKPTGNEFDVFDMENLKRGFDFAFVIGGDGTILKAARFYSEEETVIMGINTGRLGFLSQAGVSELSKITNAVLNNKIKTETRIMIKTEDYSALNDIVIKGYSNSRTLKFYLKINNKFVCDYVADGLIVATPTGSTAYGLSAGGPVLTPELNALVIVPICPHTLTARPIVVPANEKITITAAEGDLTIITDGIDTGLRKNIVDIHVSERMAKLAFLEDENFYTVLRNKLHWGVSPVNN